MAWIAAGLGPMLVHAPLVCWAVSRNGERSIPIMSIAAGMRLVCGQKQEKTSFAASAGFSRNERLSRFLRFVVEGHLDGKDNELKESVVAIEVFGRRPDFDSRLDPVVRTEAARLRARLSEYYIAQGRADAL